jgi:hypothetical protein
MNLKGGHPEVDTMATAEEKVKDAQCSSTGHRASGPATAAIHGEAEWRHAQHRVRLPVIDHTRGGGK